MKIKKFTWFQAYVLRDVGVIWCNSLDDSLFYILCDDFVNFVIDSCSRITSHVSQAFTSCTHNTSYSLLNFVHVIVCVYGLTNHVLKNTLSFMQNCFVALKNGGDCLKYKFLENWFKTCVLGEHFISFSCIFFLDSMLWGKISKNQVFSPKSCFFQNFD